MMVIWRIFLPSLMLTSGRPYRQVFARCPPYHIEHPDPNQLLPQSSKEEIEGGRVVDYTSAREVKNELRCAVNDSLADVKSWGGEFPFERAVASLEFWKI